MRNTIFKNQVAPKLILLLIGFYTLFNIVYLGKHFYFLYHFPNTPSPPWDVILLETFLDMVIIITFMYLIALNTKKLLQKNYAWSKIITLHVFLSVCISIVVRIIFDSYGLITGKLEWESFNLQNSIHRVMSIVDLNFLVYFAMLLIIYVYYYLQQVENVKRIHNVLEGQLVQTRLKMLSSQMQPHFLFNTLNNISALVKIDPDQAQETIADLSDFLREILYSSGQSLIPLKKELETLEHYLNIVRVRFSSNLIIRTEIDESLYEKEVPALILQPLIENSIKHGFPNVNNKLEIILSIKTENNSVLLKVINDGAPLKTDFQNLNEKGFGLKNINDRLENLYGKDFTFNIYNKNGNHNSFGVETCIKIPLEL